MDALLEYTTRLAKIIEKHRDRDSGEIGEMKSNEKKEATEILCKAFSHIVDSDLLFRLHREINNQFDEHVGKYSENDIDEVLRFFDTFIAFEQQLFEVRNIPAWVARETLTSAGDIKHLIRRFMIEPEFRKECLDENELNGQISRIRETVCEIHDDDVWDREKERRYVIGALAVGWVNTAADLASGTMILFSLISSAASAVVAWQRTHW